MPSRRDMIRRFRQCHSEALWGLVPLAIAINVAQAEGDQGGQESAMDALTGAVMDIARQKDRRPVVALVKPVPTAESS